MPISFFTRVLPFAIVISLVSIAAAARAQAPPPPPAPAAPPAPAEQPALAAPAPAAPNAPAAPSAPEADTPAASPATQAAEPGYLGLVTDDRQAAGKGVRVTEAVANGPAAKAGLTAGDLIVGIDGKPVHGNADMGAAIGSLPPGSQVVFTIDRNGKQLQRHVTLGTRPAEGDRPFAKLGPVEETLPAPAGPVAAPPAATAPANHAAAGAPPLPAPSPPAPEPPTGFRDNPSLGGGPRPVPQPGATERPRGLMARRPLLGVRTQPVTDDIRNRLRLTSTAGAIVVARTVGLPAERAGIPVGAVIVAVNNDPVSSPQDLARLVSQAGTSARVDITYLAEGSKRRVAVVLGEVARSGSGLRPNPLPVAGEPSPDRPAAPPNEDRRAPPSTDRPAAPESDRAEIEALKRHVTDLEQRVRELEQAEKK